MSGASPVARAVISNSHGAQWTADEYALRVDLAAAYRLVAHYGMDDLVQTHISVRLPTRRDRFLINPFGLLFSEITASSLLEIDHEGNVVSPTESPINVAGFVIHSAIHMARPDLDCVMHTHTQAGIAVSTMSEGLLPISQWAMVFHNRIGCHPYEGVALELGERARLAADLSSNYAMLLRNHGLLTAGRTIAQAFYLMYYLDRACRVQMHALAMGRTLVLPDAATCEKAARQFWDDPVAMGDREWPALLRELDRLDPGFRA
jgi:ribulose-5-phosphate 4-epimerase/fuculose-1-phosphate aldolase